MLVELSLADEERARRSKSIEIRKKTLVPSEIIKTQIIGWQQFFFFRLHFRFGLKGA